MKTSLTIFLLCSIHLAYSQSWELVGKFEPGQEISATSVDSKGQIYIGTTEGNLIRYNVDGVEDEYYSALNNSAVSMIQTWNRLKVFTFFQKQQSIAVLDRFTTTPKTIDLRDLGLQFAWLFTPGVDNSYWAFSTETKELIKYDDQNLNILFRIALKNDIKLDKATYMRAFKNLLIISDENSGIWIFDQFGDLKGQILEKGIRQIQIDDNFIHATNGNDYLKFDPFKLEIIERKKAPGEGAFWSVEISGERFLFFSRNEVYIYELH